MTKSEREEYKAQMLEEMREHNWDSEVDENSSYIDVKSEYRNMYDAFDAGEDAMFPNGRDYDAEDY